MATRRERVILELQDNFSSGMARAAAATALLDKNLKGLDGSTTRADRNLTALGSPSGGLSKSNTQLVKASSEIDRFSGRMRLLADTAAILGPGLVPIAAVGIPAVTGLASQMGAAALATGTAVIAFQGVGTTLEAVNEAALEPTTENLEAARIAMQNLSPEARSFVRTLQDMRPAFEGLRDSAAAGLFPGLERGLNSLTDILPNAERLLFAIGDAAGDVAAEFAEGLAGPRGQEFLDFLGAEMPKVLVDLGHTVGNLAGGLAELWMAFTPLNRDATGWLLDASRDFDTWAQGLSKTQGFEDFVAYVRENGPRVADAMGSIGNAVLQIVEAAAPLGGPVLEGLTAVADLIASIANSNAGPVIMATVTSLAALNRGMRAFESVSQSSWGKAIRGVEGFEKKVSTIRSTALRGTGALAGLGIAASGAADGIGLTNTVSGALLGSLGGPWGMAVGGAVGLMIDFASSNEDSSAAVEQVTATLNEQTGAITANTREWAAKQLLDSGALEQASRLGLDLDRVTDAALGQGDAVRYVNEETARLIAQSFEGEFFDPEMNKDAKDLRENINGVAGAVVTSQGDFRLLQAATGDVAGGFNRAQSAAESFRTTIEQLNRFLEGRANLRDYEQAVDDLAKTLREAGNKAQLLNKNGRINIDLEKGREVQAALDNIASTAIRVAENMRGTQKVQVLNQARRDLIDTAKKFDLPRSAVQDLLSRLNNLSSTRATPNVALEGADAVQNALSNVSSWLNNLDGKTANTTVVTTHITRGRAGGWNDSSGGLAEGGTVPKTGLAYADRHPYLLADGEEVISNRFGQADRHRELLKAINANRLADGGTALMSRPYAAAAPSVTVGSPSVSVGGPQVRVFIDGREVRHVVRRELSSDRTYHDRLDDRD